MVLDYIKEELIKIDYNVETINSERVAVTRGGTGLRVFVISSFRHDIRSYVIDTNVPSIHWVHAKDTLDVLDKVNAFFVRSDLTDVEKEDPKWYRDFKGPYTISDAYPMDMSEKEFREQVIFMLKNEGYSQYAMDSRESIVSILQHYINNRVSYVYHALNNDVSKKYRIKVEGGLYRPQEKVWFFWTNVQKKSRRKAAFIDIEITRIEFSGEINDNDSMLSYDYVAFKSLDECVEYMTNSLVKDPKNVTVGIVYDDGRINKVRL